MSDAAHQTDSTLMGSSPELKRVADRARRRRWLLVAPGIVGGIVGGMTAGVFGSHRHPVHHHHASSTAVAVALSVLALVVLGEVALFVWLGRRHKGLFGPQPILGLPYRGRRSVLRAVRRGEPPADRTLRVVGYVTARRMVRFRTFSVVCVIIVSVVELLNAALPDRTPAARLFFAASAVFFIVLVGWQLRVLRGAETYVHRFEEQPDRA